MCEPVSARKSFVTPEPMVFRAIDTHSQPSPESKPLDALICELLYAARDLASSNILPVNFRAHSASDRICVDCAQHSRGRDLVHAEGCRVARVMEIFDRMFLAQSGAVPPVPTLERRKEDMRTTEDAELEGANAPAAAFGEPWKRETRPLAHEQVLLDNDAFVMASGFEEGSPVADRVKACVNFCSGIPTEVLAGELPLASERRMRWHEIQHLGQALPWLRKLTCSQGVAL